MNYTLQDLNLHIRQVIALNFREPVWITAEIAEANVSRGHLYLNLIQKTADQTVLPGDDSIVAQAQAVVWQRDRRRMAKEHGQLAELVLQSDVQARLLVRVDFHERYGLKLHVEDIDPTFSMGVMALQRRQTIETLQKEGLLRRNQNLPLPVVLQRIAVITSPEAAGFHDFKAHLAENAYGYTFQYRCFFTAVQGRNAAPEIIGALDEIATRPHDFDAVVIIRGGGAKLDLSAFDSLALGRTVAQMPLPVLAGIGHETDESVLDLVAYRSFKTPTAVADFLLESALHFESQLLETSAHIGFWGQKMTRYAAESLQMVHAAVFNGAQRVFITAEQQLANTARDIPYLARQICQTQRAELDRISDLVLALSPQTTLARGYSLTTRDGMIIRSATELTPGDTIETQLADGRVTSQVTG